MIPERYGNLDGDSGITHYAIGPDYIAVQFREPAVYVYDWVRPGRIHVDRMAECARGARSCDLRQSARARPLRTQAGRLVRLRAHDRHQGPREGRDGCAEARQAFRNTAVPVGCSSAWRYQ